MLEALAAGWTPTLSPTPIVIGVAALLFIRSRVKFAAVSYSSCALPIRTLVDRSGLCFDNA